MAIKVSGTTVINDSRELTNITAVDATTVAALGSAGVGGGGGIELTTSEAVVEGDTLAMNFDTGKVEKVARVGGSGAAGTSIPYGQRTGFIKYIPSQGIYAISFGNSQNNYTSIILAKLNASTKQFTFGSRVDVESNTYYTQGSSIEYCSTANRIVYLHYDFDTNNYQTTRLLARSYSFNTTTLALSETANTYVENDDIENGPSYPIVSKYCSAQNRLLVMYKLGEYHSSNPRRGTVKALTVGSSSISVSSQIGPSGGLFTSSNDFDMPAIAIKNSTVMFSFFTDGNLQVRAAIMSGSSLSYGSPVYLTASQSYERGSSFVHNNTTGSFGDVFGLFYRSGTTGYIRNLQINSSTAAITDLNSIYGSNNLAQGVNETSYLVYDSDNNRVLYGRYVSGTVYMEAQALRTDRPEPTGSQLTGATLFQNQSRQLLHLEYDPDAELSIIATYSSEIGYYAPIDDNYLDFVGVAKEAASANSTVKIANAGQIATGLSGLTAGNAYRINYDGTFQNLGMNDTRTQFNGTQRDRVSGRALTSTTMLMMNDFMSAS